jgi:hypothetical protein
MRIHAEKQRAIDLLPFPVQANGQDMPFIERLFECGTRCPEVPKATRCSGTDGSGVFVL